MTKQLVSKFFRSIAGTPSDVGDGVVVLTQSAGGVEIDRESLHQSAGFRRQIEALKKIDAELQKDRELDLAS